MEQIGKSSDWGDSELFEPTMDPNISVSVIEEKVPTLTVAAIVGVTVVILIAIAAVFLLGVLMDWRQQRMLEKKMGEVKRLKNQRRVNSHPEADDVSISANMEEPVDSIAPAEILRTIP
ncbi:unnamed protein product [Diatraea saccharalis]|uniref:Uncharacterized protein n=1 Tax=Diatraea saccharalis TaxID=40085 RepID=A0A9P0C2W2_9NEOP|nr:unnamed protein product [Diatraea saccharalis]